MRKWMCLLAVVSTAVTAAPVTYEFTGVIDAVADVGPPGGIYEGLPSYFPGAGTAFSGQVTWDRDSLVPGFTTCNGGPYCGGLYDLSITFGAITLADLWATAGDYSLATDAVGNTISARAEIAQATWSDGTVSGPLEVLALDFSFASALGDPATLLSLPDSFAGGTLYVVDGFAFDNFSGTIDTFGRVGTAPVPEPATMALMGLGIAGLLVAHRRLAELIRRPGFAPGS